ncbi:MAG: lipoyl(octanoyl) transferase LipB [Myxococcota bacterium]
MAVPAPRLLVEDLGRVPYAEALALQEAALTARRRGERPDTLFLLEHPPVVTLGRGSRKGHLRDSPEALRARGFEVFEARRGGDVTYHGPGQLVGYPVLDLSARGERDLHAYLRSLEDLLVTALASLGLPARTVPGYTGVFVGEGEALPGRFPRKLASIGVGVRGWVTWHGFALNVDVQLEAFEAIVPCGLEGVEMTSVERELGAGVPADLPARAREAVRASFLSRYG